MWFAGRAAFQISKRRQACRAFCSGYRIPPTAAFAANATLSLDASHDTKSLPLERFRAKWNPVRVKKTRQNNNLESFSVSMKR
jgi:hypothetical protein